LIDGCVVDDTLLDTGGPGPEHLVEVRTQEEHR